MTAAQRGWAGRAGTLVVIEGPRFSSRAESQWFAAQGWTLVGMTGHPEAVLARELAPARSRWPWSPTWTPPRRRRGRHPGRSFEVFAADIKRLRDLAATIIAALPADRAKTTSAPTP